VTPDQRDKKLREWAHMAKKRNLPPDFYLIDNTPKKLSEPRLEPQTS
jgi:hypothetical protein